MIPQGRYRLLTYEVFRKNDQGDLWRLSAGATLESPFINVGGSSESVLEFGEPYVPIVNIRGSVASRYYLMFNEERAVPTEFIGRAVAETEEVFFPTPGGQRNCLKCHDGPPYTIPLPAGVRLDRGCSIAGGSPEGF